MPRLLIIYSILLSLIFQLTAQEKTSSNPPAITFAEHISPIVYENCTVCHRPEGVAPFSLIGYQNVRRRARQIAEVTTSRFMPPWKPDEGHGPEFIGNRRLTNKEIELFQTWYKTGSKSGDLDTIPQVPQYSSEWRLGEPDLVITLPEAYTLPADGGDIYRNFAIPLNLNTKKYVRALEFRPSSQLVIHHAVVMVDHTSGSSEREAIDPEPGYDGMGFGTSSIPNGQFIGWTPGQAPYQAYPGTAWTIEPNSDLVLELHMLPSGKEEIVKPQIGFYFTNTPPERPSQIISLRQFEIDIAPGQTDYIVEQEMEIPIDVEVLGVYPHAHFIGKDLSIYSIFPDGSKHWLIRISDWDFNWQADYRYKKPMKIPAGSKIHMHYRYDNSAENLRNPNFPPKPIKSGWKSTDEMAEATIQLLLQNENDVLAIQKAQQKYDVDSAGGLSRYLYNLGSYYELQSVLEKAGEMFYKAIQEDPRFASAYYKLGYILEQMGNNAQAEQRYNQALAIKPELIPAHVGLARIYYYNKSDILAMWELKKVLEWEKYNYDARLYMVRILIAQKNYSKATKLLEQGIQYHGQNPYYRMELGKLLASQGKFDEAIEHLGYAYKNEVVQDRPLSQFDRHKLKSEALYSIGNAFEKKGEKNLALDYYTKAIKEMPYHVRAYLDSSKLLLEQGNRDAALLRLNELINLSESIKPTIEEISAHHNSSQWHSLVNEVTQ